MPNYAPTFAITQSPDADSIDHKNNDLFVVADAHGNALDILRVGNKTMGLNISPAHIKHIAEKQVENNKILTDMCWADSSKLSPDFTGFRQILDKDDKQRTPEEKKIFAAVEGWRELEAYENLFPTADTHTGLGKQFVAIGDLLADRETNSLLMLVNFQKMHELNENFSIIYSNHDMVFLKVFNLIKQELNKLSQEGIEGYQNNYDLIKTRILDPMWKAIADETGNNTVGPGDDAQTVKATNQRFYDSFYSLVSFGFSMEKMVYELHQVKVKQNLVVPFIQVAQYEASYLKHLKMAEKVDLMLEHNQRGPHYMTHAPQVFLNVNESQDLLAIIDKKIDELAQTFEPYSAMNIVRVLSEYLPTHQEGKIADLKTLITMLHVSLTSTSDDQKKATKLKELLDSNGNNPFTSVQDEKLYDTVVKKVFKDIDALLVEVRSQQDQPTSVFGLWHAMMRAQMNALKAAGSTEQVTGIEEKIFNYHQTLSKIIIGNVYGDTWKGGSHWGGPRRAQKQATLEECLGNMIQEINGFVKKYPHVLYDETQPLYNDIQSFIWNRNEVIGLNSDQVRVSNIFGHQGTSLLNKQRQNSNPRAINIDLIESKSIPNLRCVFQAKHFSSSQPVRSIKRSQNSALAPNSIFSTVESAVKKRRSYPSQAGNQNIDPNVDPNVARLANNTGFSPVKSI